MEKFYGITDNNEIIYLNKFEKITERMEYGEKSENSIIYYFRESSIADFIKTLKSLKIDELDLKKDYNEMFGFSTKQLVKKLGNYEEWEEWEEKETEENIQDIIWYFKAENAIKLLNQFNNLQNDNNMLYVIDVNINYNKFDIEILDKNINQIKKYPIKEFLKLYKKNKEIFNFDTLKNEESKNEFEDFLSKNKMPKFSYTSDKSKFFVSDFKNFLIENENKLDNLENEEYKIYLYTNFYSINKDFKLDFNYNYREVFEYSSKETKFLSSLNAEELKDFKTLNVIEKDEGLIIEFKNMLQKSLFLKESFKLFKTKVYESDFSKNYVIKNKTNLYFLMNTMENFNFSTDKLKKEDIQFFKQLDNMNESFQNIEVSNNDYVNNVNGFIDRNRGKAVIADSTSQKEEAVTVYLNNNSNSNLIIGKPESLEKYQSLGLKNSDFIKNTVFSSSKDIIEVKTKSNSLYRLDKNKDDLYLNEDIIRNNVKELIVEKNGEIKYSYLNDNKELQIEQVKGSETHYFITEETKKMIDKYKNVESFVLSDAEKIKDSKSLMFYSLLGVVENLNLKNKLFVSSNPIYNTIKEIEPLLNILDNDLLEEIKYVLSGYSSRELKSKKDEFLLKILKKYILKRDKSELNLMTSTEQSNSIKETNYINKRVGVLKEEQEYYDNVKNGINKYLTDIIKFSLKRVEGKYENNPNSIEYYMTDFDKFKVLQGKKLSDEQKYQISLVYNTFNKKEDGINLSSYKRNYYSKEFIQDNFKDLPQERKDKIKLIKEAREYNLTESLYERVLKTPFNKIKEYDTINNELIDGVHIKKRHILEIKSEKKDNGLTNGINNFIFPDEDNVYNQKIEKILYSCKTNKVYLINDIESRIKINNKEIDPTRQPNLFNRMTNKQIQTSFSTVEEKNDYFNKLKKEVNDAHNRLVLILEGEKVSFYKLLEKQLNLKIIHKKMAELKTKNTIRVANELLDNKENIMICSMYNGVIDELKEKFPEAIVVKNKTDLENLEIEEGKTKIVLSTFNKLGENVQNKFEGSLIYNDLPWNKATSEKVENSLSQKNINVYINSMDGNILDNLFVSRNNAKTENLKKLFNTGEKFEQLTDGDFKDLMIKNIFKDFLTGIDEEFFLEVKRTTEQEIKIIKTIQRLSQDFF